MLVAGEPSGDLLGARLMAGLRELTGDRVEFVGIGGEQMIAGGLHSLFPMEELSVMGLVEVLPRARRILRRLRQTTDFALAQKPDVLVTIDSPGFCYRLAERLQGHGIPLVHFVAPQVWAWKAKRIVTTARLFDRLLCLLPFEPALFPNMQADFVGHPVVEGGAGRGDGAAFLARHGIAPTATVLAVLPGSRAGEVGRHLPIFRATVTRLQKEWPDLHTVMPTVAGVADLVRASASTWPGRLTVVSGQAEKFNAFAAANVALAASGTVALELALSRVPAVIAYRLSPITAWLVRRAVKVRYVNLVNILLDRPVVPELLQEDCRPDRLAAALGSLLADEGARHTQLAEIDRVATMLGQGGEAPSRRAAAAVLEAIKGDSQ